MISTALVIVSAAMAMQASDTTRAARESFTHCLRVFVDASTHAHKTLAQFNTEFPQACPAEQAALRQAVIQRDMASRSTRASASRRRRRCTRKRRSSRCSSPRGSGARPRTPRSSR